MGQYYPWERGKCFLFRLLSGDLDRNFLSSWYGLAPAEDYWIDRSVPVSAFTLLSRDRSTWMALRCEINCCRQSSTASFKRTSSLRYCWACGVDLTAAKRGSEVSALPQSSIPTARFNHSAVAAGDTFCPAKAIISSSNWLNLLEQLSNSSKVTSL